MSVTGALSLLLGVAQGLADPAPAARLTVIAGTDDTRSLGGALVVIGEKGLDAEGIRRMIAD